MTKNRYYEIIKHVYPVIMDILNEMCHDEKERMTEIEPCVLGSWKKAVVTSDGVWHTRGHFSKNGSFVIKNYLTGGLLWCGHKCMRGIYNVIEEELYEGTAKSMEGVLADQCYQQVKAEGCKVNTVWDDGDSTSRNTVSLHHPTAKVYKCGGHTGREAAKKEEFSEDMKRKYREKFPSTETGKCKCSRHKSGCGCLSDSFIKGACINHFIILWQSETTEEYASRIQNLSTYHCRDVHKWEGGACD